MGKTIAWGILGTGNIATQFATGVKASTRGTLAAVGSRKPETAAAFGTKFAIPNVGGYEQLIADKSVEAIYVSLPNSMHHEWTLKALRAGKHVLCEKPISSNEAEAVEMFDVAQKSGKILVEAFMYRAHPQTHSIQKQIRDGAIGKVKMIRTSFCYYTRTTEGNVRFSSELVGGSLMDIGCYCISFSRLFAGEEPSGVQAFGKMHESGVDESAVGIMQFANGVIAHFASGMRVQAENTAYICGDEGYIEIGWPWKPGKTVQYTIAHSTPPRQDKSAAGKAPPPRETIDIENPGDLYGLEADDFATSVLDGKPLMVSRQDSIGNMRVLDTMRRQIGLRV